MRIFPSFEHRSIAFFILLVVPVFSIQADNAPDSWYRKKVTGLNAHLRAVAFGNHQFIAVGQASTIARSTDGLNWTPGSAGAYGDLGHVRFVNGQFVAFPSSSQLLFSSDGIAWESRPIPARYAVDIAFGNGGYVLATADDPLYSTDGSQWQPIETRNPNSLPWEAPLSAELQVVVFGKGRFLGFHREHQKVAIPPVSSIAIQSIDGLQWSSLGASFADLAETGGKLEFGLSLYALTRGQAAGVSISEEGSLWMCSEDCGTGGVPPNTYEAGTATSDKLLIRVRSGAVFPSGDGPHITYSTNGTDWQTALRFPSPAEDPQSDYYEPLRGSARAVAYGDGVFVVVGDNGYIIASSLTAGAPSILSEPVDQIAKSGTPAEFKVLASGASPLTYQWFHNGQPMEGATTDRYSIAQVAIRDAGTYQVTVSNALGSVQSRLATLDVAFADVQLYAGIRISGTIGKRYRVEGTPVIGPENWQLLDVVQLSTTPFIWMDLHTTEEPRQFYRVIELQ